MISLEVKGYEELQSAFANLSRIARDLRPWWPAVARVFWDVERVLFEMQGAGHWMALAPKYQARKLRHYPSTGILERTGDLKRSLTGPSAPGAVYDPQPQTLNLGTTIRYADYHRTGTRRMPARPPIIMTESDEQKMLEVLLDKFREYARGLGFEVK